MQLVATVRQGPDLDAAVSALEDRGGDDRGRGEDAARPGTPGAAGPSSGGPRLGPRRGARPGRPGRAGDRRGRPGGWRPVPGPELRLRRRRRPPSPPGAARRSPSRGMRGAAGAPGSAHRADDDGAHRDDTDRLGGPGGAHRRPGDDPEDDLDRARLAGGLRAVRPRSRRCGPALHPRRGDGRVLGPRSAAPAGADGEHGRHCPGAEATRTEGLPRRPAPPSWPSRPALRAGWRARGARGGDRRCDGATPAARWTCWPRCWIGQCGQDCSARPEVRRAATGDGSIRRHARRCTLAVLAPLLLAAARRRWRRCRPAGSAERRLPASRPLGGGARPARAGRDRLDHVLSRARRPGDRPEEPRLVSGEGRKARVGARRPDGPLRRGRAPPGRVLRQRGPRDSLRGPGARAGHAGLPERGSPRGAAVPAHLCIGGAGQARAHVRGIAPPGATEFRPYITARLHREH